MAEYFTQKCEICGKEIVTHGAKNWGYKIKEPKGPYKFFCSYKCQRKYEKDHPEKKVDVIAKAAAEEAKKPKKMPTERGCIARSLIDVIRHGGNPIEFLREQGYKNPYEAYSSVRHYCETNEPHLAEVLKPLKELPKGPQQKTGRPKKEPAEVEKVDKVPPVEEKLEPVHCIAHVTDAELAEAEEPKSEDAHLETETIQVDENTMRQVFHFYTREDLLRIVDAAALKCQADKCYRWGSDTLEQQMFHDARTNAVGIGVMKLRGEIRKMLGADEDEDA